MRRCLFFALCIAIGFGQSGCDTSAGGETFSFQAFAAGPTGLGASGPYVFHTPRGYRVQLDQAQIHIGAVYLNEAVPTSVSSDTSCTLPGVYVAELTAGMDVDLLSGEPTAFPELGLATDGRARTAELWLSGGEVEAPTDPTIIVSVRGTAERGSEVLPFDATLTISDNRKLPPSDTAQPGEKPICKQRIVSPIAVDTQGEPDQRLMLRIDPAGWFGNVEFSELEQVADNPPRFRFRDDSTDQPSRNLYAGVRASAGVYSLSWE